MKTTIRTLALAAIAAGISAGPVAAQGYNFPLPAQDADDLYVTSQEVFVQYLGFEAAYHDHLYFWVGNPWAGGTGYMIINNQTSTVPGQVLRLNDFVGAGYLFTPGDRIYFSLYVADDGAWTNGDDDDLYKTYYTAPAFYNPDGMPHAKIAAYSGSDYYDPSGVNRLIAFDHQIGFEDILQDNDQPNPDWDYDDLVFATQGVGVTPEPMTVLLMATGLVGVMGVAYRRRKHDAAGDMA
jgi:hypothetical protein